MVSLYMDFKDIVSVSFKFLYFFGIMYPKFDSWYVIILYCLKVSFFMGFFFGGIVLAELVNLYYSLNNLTELMKALFLTLTNLVSVFKYYVICKNQKKLLILTEKINRKEFQPQSLTQFESLKNYVKMSKIISFLLYAGCTATCSFWAVYPYTDEDGPFLPIAAYIPFETKNSTLFGLVYVYEIMATVIGGYTDLSADCLMASLLMVVCAQLNILNDTLAHIRDIAESEMNQNKFVTKFYLKNRKDILQKVMNFKLVECIMHHRYIIEFAEDWTHIFTISLFGQFIVSVFVFCATFFEMTQVSFASVRFFSMALYQYCMLLEIFPVCYFGNEVIVESNKLTNSAYHSNWMDCSLEFQKNLLFFMTRSQRVIKLFAGNFFTLSLDTFIKILKSSWSYVAVLIQVNNK